MIKLFGTLLTSLISTLLARVLLGAGLTIITYDWINDIVDNLITKVETELNSLPEFALSLVNLWELDKCFAMIFSTIQILLLVRVAKTAIGKKT